MVCYTVHLKTYEDKRTIESHSIKFNDICVILALSHIEADGKNWKIVASLMKSNADIEIYLEEGSP